MMYVWVWCCLEIHVYGIVVDGWVDLDNMKEKENADCEGGDETRAVGGDIY